jgi:hypothetical protein
LRRLRHVGDGTRLVGSQLSVIVDGNSVRHDLTVAGNAGADINGDSATYDVVCQSNGPQTGAGNTAGIVSGVRR